MTARNTSIWPPLIEAKLIRRYKRFLADVELADGSVVTVHCPNTGAMTGCDVPGSRVWLSAAGNARRKYAFTWELVESGNARVCIHSALANRFVHQALLEDRIEALAGYGEIRREVKVGDGSRVDFVLANGGTECYVEVKSVTLHLGSGLGVFPDAVSDRASRHLRELIALRECGHRAVLLFAVLHGAIRKVAPADHIDACYGNTLRAAVAAGVDVLAIGGSVTLDGVTLGTALPVLQSLPIQAAR